MIVYIARRRAAHVEAINSEAHGGSVRGHALVLFLNALPGLGGTAASLPSLGDKNYSAPWPACPVSVLTRPRLAGLSLPATFSPLNNYMHSSLP